MKRNISLSLIVATICASCLLGCSRSASITYSIMESEDGELSTEHAGQIKQQLARHFGTPANPKLDLAPDTESEDATERYPEHLLVHGAKVFNRRCAGCHGVTGDGQGEAAAYLQPKPRDYRRGVFKFTSTPFGAKPRRIDLEQIIRRGAKGTSMPSFKFLPDKDVEALVSYVIALSYRGELERKIVDLAINDFEPEQEIPVEEYVEALEQINEEWQEAEGQGVLPITAQPRMTDETVRLGRKAFLSKGCVTCHGSDFRGQTEWLSHEFLELQSEKPELEREKINYDVWKQPAPAADLTTRMLHGGRRPIDIYRRIYTGINGTPMPAFSDSLSKEPETIWHLVHYVLSVVEGREVEGLEDVKPEPREGT